MGIKEALQKIGNNSKERKEKLRQMIEQDQLDRTVLERRKSSNQRELEGYHKENYEADIKVQLEHMRKKRRDDIALGHNPLDVKNITASTQWEVLKEKNQFAGRSNMFQGNGNIHKSNKNLLKSGNVLHGKNIMIQKGSGLI